VTGIAGDATVAVAVTGTVAVVAEEGARRLQKFYSEPITQNAMFWVIFCNQSQVHR
jgi:hypothetical protein